MCILEDDIQYCFVCNIYYIDYIYINIRCYPMAGTSLRRSLYSYKIQLYDISHAYLEYSNIYQ